MLELKYKSISVKSKNLKIAKRPLTCGWSSSTVMSIRRIRGRSILSTGANRSTGGAALPRAIRSAASSAVRRFGLAGAMGAAVSEDKPSRSAALLLPEGFSEGCRVRSMQGSEVRVERNRT